ncbi:MAG: YdeI/OmpD-associated family protein [Dysgonomonas sp.]
MDKTIIKKLNIENYARKVILNKPDDIKVFDELSFDKIIGKGKYDLVFAFIFSLEEFIFLLKIIIQNDILNHNGMLYYAYPKKGNKQYNQSIGRDDFFDVIDMDGDGYVHSSFMKYNKMVSFSDVFTVIGLKHSEKCRKTIVSSQSIADYIERVSDVREYFKTNKDILEIFDILTPGYQCGWARYVYNTRNPETTEKRFCEMQNVLKQGFKSIDLYKQNKNNNRFS